MKKLFFERTDNTPQVIFDIVAENYEISGRSFPKNALLFYQPIFDWLRTNIPLIRNRIEITICLEYFNSASNRVILLILKYLEEQFFQGKDILINWIYEDEEVLGDGQMYSTLVNLPFNLVELEKKCK